MISWTKKASMMLAQRNKLRLWMREELNLQ